jgi:hypothetical protein
MNERRLQLLLLILIYFKRKPGAKSLLMAFENRDDAFGDWTQHFYPPPLRLALLISWVTVDRDPAFIPIEAFGFRG